MLNETASCRRVFFSLITQHQKSRAKAEKLAQRVQEILGIDTPFGLEKYYKWDNSWRIELCFPLEDEANYILESIEKTNRLCKEWLLLFIPEHQTLHLTFNAPCDDGLSHAAGRCFREVILNTICWANWSVERIEISDLPISKIERIES
jgi:hypothetical protein